MRFSQAKEDVDASGLRLKLSISPLLLIAWKGRVTLIERKSAINATQNRLKLSNRSELKQGKAAIIVTNVCR